jgi:ribose/xylose/arabinose/galactoside ABC-type transport system permease subunit
MRLNKDKLINLALSNGILFAIIILIIVTGIIQPEFFAWSNMVNILRQISVNGIVACGMTVCIMSGCYDLSVGSIVSMTGVFAILAVNAGVSDILCVLIGLGIGIAAGVFNGVLISSINGRGGEAFIITYGTQTVLAAIALFPSKGLFIAGRVQDGLFKSMGLNNAPIYIFLVVALILHFIISKTQYGRKLCFIGNNMDAAKMSGIRVKLNRITYYAISGLLAGLAGIVLCSRVTSSNPTAGTGYEMNAIAAVVVGGNSASGGSGSIIRTVIGAIVIGIMGNALNILGFSTNYQLIVKGGLIVLAVALDILSKKIKK